ncbi:MAG: hypothetical protein U5L01_15090 [Rheinheimera sp.]|nr:hypothetical protein [Rheinheimera sp.]
MPIRLSLGEAVGFKIAMATTDGFALEIRLLSSWQLVLKEKTTQE